jgi:SAM-dependent methyltransferase
VSRRPAGDVDYDAGAGRRYSALRRPDPRIAAAVRSALGDARTLVNVGAGTGSYEPAELSVVAVEPSAAMRAQRPPSLGPVVDAVAEALPFGDRSFDAALAVATVHQWPDVAGGLGELRRVARGPVVVVTFDPAALRRFWLAEYAPDLIDREAGRMPEIADVMEHLGGRGAVVEMPIPADCIDGFAEAYFGRPEALLDDEVRRSQSAWAFLTASEQAASVGRLAAALADGSWERRHGHLRYQASYEGSLRVVVAYPG